MQFEDKTMENIMIDLLADIGDDVGKEEGTLVNHALRGAAAEFERAYMGLGVTDLNGYAATADREHLVLRAAERGIAPFKATQAVWKAASLAEIPLNTRFSAGEQTFLCTQKLDDGLFCLMCEQAGTAGNVKFEDVYPIDFVEGLSGAELLELSVPAKDEEDTEAFRARYLSIVTSAQAFGGNRAQYMQAMLGIEGVGACKIYRAGRNRRRIEIYFLNSAFQPPDALLVDKVQEIIDPAERHGEGEGTAPLFHVVDVFPCLQETVDVSAEVALEDGRSWFDLLPAVKERLDAYFSELAKSWENTERITVRILKVNAALAEVAGVVDVQGTTLNGHAGNLILEANVVPVRGAVTCASGL
jgi:uncharacterized phage protein gp47/JayE